MLFATPDIILSGVFLESTVFLSKNRFLNTYFGADIPLNSLKKYTGCLHDYKMHYFFKKQYIVDGKTLVHICCVVCVDDLRYI